MNDSVVEQIAPYESTLEHMRDEFRRLDLMLERAMLGQRKARARRAESPFGGLFISDAEADALLARDDVDEGSAGLDEGIVALRREIDLRMEECARRGQPLRLRQLADMFGLTDTERDVVIIALAPELDLRYQKLYAYVQDDVSKRRPTVDLALTLLAGSEEERLAKRHLFTETSPLFATPILSRHEDPADRPAPLLAQSLKLEERIVEFLAGGDFLESRLASMNGGVRWVLPHVELDRLVLDPGVAARLGRLVDGSLGVTRWLCFLEGGAGTGKKSVAGAICRELGHAMLVVDLRALLTAAMGGGRDLRTSIRAVWREARLYDGIVYLDHWEELLREDASAAGALDVVRGEIEACPGPIFIGSREAWHPERVAGRLMITQRIGALNDGARLDLWRRALAGNIPLSGEIDIAQLAGSFRLSGGRIERALAHARTHARLRDGADYHVTHDDIVEGCRAESSRSIISFARGITPKRTWDDLVLPRDVMAQLREFCRQVRYRVKVYGEWGFDRKLSAGKGTIALFTGTSGTGKTLSAEVLAKELGLDLFRVDLSSVVSKYIGETEKNLSRVFRDAQESNAILFFDEADALFGKRSEVKDAHDRYANIEINYLLQRVEEYEGVIILASNLSKNIDAAFLRRLHFSIEFPFPDEAHRHEIWRRVFPAIVPVADDADFAFLARQFKIAGGNIRNVALAAAFHAAEDESAVTMGHLVLAMKRELQKLGRTCERIDFEDYYDLVR